MIRYFTIFLVVFLVSCGSGEESQRIVESESSKSLQVKFAKGFTISRSDRAYHVVIRNPQDTTEVLAEYVLGNEDSTQISIPIESAILNSTTFGAFFDRLNALDEVKGMTYTQQVLNTRLSEKIDSGEIQEVISGDGIDFERVLAIDPDAVFAYSYGEADFSRYEELGIPVILLMDFRESHPLGRAEWIKVVGCFLGKYEEADSIYKAVEEQYLNVNMNAMVHSYLPSAFTGSRYGDFWYAPGRDSYIAQFIRDAGAIYSFQHIEGQGSAELDFEKALIDISKADYWGMVTSFEGEFTKEDVLEMNPLYEKISAYQNDKIFVCNTKEKDYFGDAIMEPHLILGDLHKIFHPHPEQDTVFHYFKPIP